MKNKRITAYIVCLIVLLLCLSIGTVAAITKEQYKNNNIYFTVSDEDAFCSLEAKYFYCGQEQTDQAYEKKMYTESNRYSKDGFEGFGSWKNLTQTSYFDKDYEGSAETIGFEFRIQNLNTEKDLYVSLYDIAVGEQFPQDGNEVYFYTTVIYNVNGQQTTIFSNKGEKENYNETYVAQGQKQKVSLNSKNTACKIPVNQSAVIKIEMERKTIVKQFEIKNNIKVNLSTTAPQA